MADKSIDWLVKFYRMITFLRYSKNSVWMDLKFSGAHRIVYILPDEILDYFFLSFSEFSTYKLLTEIKALRADILMTKRRIGLSIELIPRFEFCTMSTYPSFCCYQSLWFLWHKEESKKIIYGSICLKKTFLKVRKSFEW